MEHVVGVFETLWYELEAEQLPPEDTELAQQRENARTLKQYAEADRLRTLIEQQGFRVEDTPSGPRVLKLAQ